MKKYLAETQLLDFKSNSIADLIKCNGWNELDKKNKIAAVYEYVRDRIPFGFNKSDDISASAVLADGFGQCNTKCTLFMALLRAVGVPCRLHGFAIHKRLQKGLINGFAYLIAPKEILHSWVEVRFSGRWYSLEGLILDRDYLEGLKSRFKGKQGAFCGFGVDVKDFNNLQINWNECNTFIQKEGIVKDFGLFDSPDDYFREHGTNLRGIKKIIYKGFVSFMMNTNVKKIRI